MRMVLDTEPISTSQWAAIVRSQPSSAALAETLRKWVRQTSATPAHEPGPTTASSSASRLEREVRELRQANEILR